jgi:HlyD family secretion protein
MQRLSVKAWFGLVAGLLALGLAVFYGPRLRDTGYGPGFVSGNGRIEATEIDISSKLSGRIKDITVNEGDFVKAGQALAYMNSDVLQAQLQEAQAQLQQAGHGVASARAQVVARQSDRAAALAIVTQRETELLLARQRLERSERLVTQGATSRQTLDEHRAGVSSAVAVLEAAKAQVAAAAAAIEAAQAQVIGAESAVRAAQATVARIQADITDSILVSPRDGRVQFRVSQPGEVVSAGGKLLNVVDLTDVYMTFFLPESVAGRVALGAPVRIILDAAPEYVIPASISFVASTAQFTPKTVETASERQKLMFRVKARLDPALLRKYLTQVKTGLPGVAWVRLDNALDWPDALRERLPH